MDVHVAISSPHFIYQSQIDFIKEGFIALGLPNVKGVYPQYVEIAHSFPEIFHFVPYHCL
jgi:hypothetical protein